MYWQPDYIIYGMELLNLQDNVKVKIFKALISVLKAQTDKSQTIFLLGEVAMEISDLECVW